MLADDKWSEAGLWDALRKSFWEDRFGILVKERYDFRGIVSTSWLIFDNVYWDGDHGCDETSRAGPCNDIKVLP